jgi:hypothetical protein
MVPGNSDDLFGLNWVAIASFAGSVAYSAVFWTGLILAVHHFVR